MPSPTRDTSGVGYGVIGGAASALAAPLIRDGLYGGSQTVIDNGDGTQTIKYGNVGYNATTVALAALIGGAAGALLGTNATAAALAAQNEALNNSTSVKFVPRPVATPFGVVMMPMPVVTDDPIGTPNNGPQKSDPLTNPLEEQNSNGNAIATPNNGPQGSTLTSTPANGPQGPTILGNPGCMLALAICAGLTAIVQMGDLFNALGGGSATDVNLASPDRTAHILQGDATGGGHLWPGAPGKSVFPQDWSPSKIMNDVSDIATDPSIPSTVQSNGRIVAITRSSKSYSAMPCIRSAPSCQSAIKRMCPST